MTADLALLFAQQALASGIVSGGIYALLAAAVVLIFKISEVVNFGQGEVFMAAGYAMLALWLFPIVPLWLGVPIAVAVPVLCMWFFQGVVLTRIERSKGLPVHVVIATLGMAYCLKGVVRLSGLGDTPRSFPSYVSTDTLRIGGAVVTYLDLTIVAVSLVLIAALFGLLLFTRIGLAMRAVGVNVRAASLVGINISRIQAVVWALSGLISAIAALLVSPKLLMTPDMGDIITMSFAAAIIGGFNSLPGAVIGGFVVGIAQNLVGVFVSSSAIVVTPFVAIMLVLILRPQGLFGGKFQQKKV
ncbi:MAG: branched-chain amino acid ABC transporter permease [Rubrivivax sp.]